MGIGESLSDDNWYLKTGAPSKSADNLLPDLISSSSANI